MTRARKTAGRVSGKAARRMRRLTGRRTVLDRVRGIAGRPGLFLLGAGAVGVVVARVVRRSSAGVTATGTTQDAVTSGPTGSSTSGLPGTATGQPTAGVEVADAGGVRTGTDLVEPYPVSGGPLFGTTPDGGYVQDGVGTAGRRD